MFCHENWLTQRYGPKLYSEEDEELIIRDFFHDRRGGYFADIGSGHFRNHSTTYYLEKALGWHGLAVDANCAFGDDYSLYRRHTRFFCYFVGAKSDTRVEFFIQPANLRLSTGDAALASRWFTFQKTSVPSITLDDLLNLAGAAHIDFLSMDIERGEPAALSGFDIERYRPEFVCIESYPEVREQILDYFFRFRYVIVRTYDGLDSRNLYFAPRERAAGPAETSPLLEFRLKRTSIRSNSAGEF